MNENIMFDTNKDILFQIAMITYERHNSNIANINDNLGDMYSYKDLQDAERFEQEDEKHLLELAVKQLQNEIQQLKSQLKKGNDVIDEITNIINQYKDFCKKKY